ncbi:MAG: hypothetical protein JWR80_1319, partial [Bradyrhizobium sp.]|nr:hypothetical protein [Bradyrhizobium sp.]
LRFLDFFAMGPFLRSFVNLVQAFTRQSFFMMRVMQGYFVYPQSPAHEIADVALAKTMALKKSVQKRE